MDRRACSSYPSAEQALDDDVLQIRLPDIDDVVYGVPMTEGRMIASASRRRGDPDVSGGIEQFVLEVLVQQADFPQLIGDVLADIGHRAVGSDDDLVVFVTFGLEPHDPAAGVLALVSRRRSRFFCLQLLERVIPEFEMKDVAFPRQQIVCDIDPRHRSQMATDDRHRDDFCHARRIVIAFFDFLQRLPAQSMFRIFRFVKRSDPGINVPAVIVEFDRLDLRSSAGHRLSDFFSTCLKPTMTSATCTPVLSM